MKNLWKHGHPDLQAAEKYFDSVSDDLLAYMKDEDLRENGNYDYPSLAEYPLDVEDEENYHRILLTYGGPTIELRFYTDCIAFVYQNQDGDVAFNATDKKEYQFVKDYLGACYENKR